MAESKPKTGEPHVDGEFDRELNYRAILGFVVGTALLAGITFVLSWQLGGGLKGYLRSTDEAPSPIADATMRPVPPKPHLQTLPYQDLIEMHAVEDSVLNSYALVDADAQKVRIPIDEAMRRVARAGIPDWPAVDPAATN